jgi:LPXTG-motif cell wall-anchored protein
LSNGDIYNADYEEGTEIKIVSKSNENAVIDDVALNNSTISGFTSGKKSFSFVYKTKTADANFGVTFKTKETQKAENSTTEENTSEQSSVQNEDSNTSEDASSNDENEDSSTDEGDKVRLVYQGKKKNLDSDLISAKYSNMYVLEYGSQDEADKAKSELKDKGAKVDTEQVLSMDENTQSSADVVSTKDIDTAINQADQKNVKDYSGKNVIALIDTGTDGSTVDAVSFVDGDTTDHQGHASKMIKAIRKQDSNAKILALKALDDNGNGTTASIVSAIQYAIDSHVSIINMSFSGKANDDTSLIEAKVKEAVKAGITVVASAGNNALDASNFVPANVSGVITVGACSDKGIILSYSNYGDDVNWYVNTDATSGASATVLGMISKNGKVKEDKKTVFSSKNAVENTTKWANSTGDNISVADAGGSGGGSGGGGGNMPSTVSWRIRDNNDNGFGLALVNGQPNTDAVLNVIMNNMNLYCLPDYVTNGTSPRMQVRNALQNAINQCRANYQKIYGTTDGFKPRIVAVGVCHYAHAYQGKSGEYNTSWYANDEWYWNPAWKNASNNNTLTLYHGGKAYTTASAFHNGGNSLTNMATNDLAGNSNIRIIVLDDTQPEPPIKKGKLCIKKTSANPAITDNNPCYSLKGAEYGVYKSENDAKADKNKVNTLTIGKYDNTEKNKNWSNEIELKAGTYYVKETKAPKGYALNPNAVKVVIEAGKNTWIGEASSGFEDYPQSDPIPIVLGKIDKETNKNKPQGSASLEGAEFTVKYYKGLYDEDPAKSGQTPARSWVLKTDKDGYSELSKDYKVSGDDFYYASNGDPTFPVGTITIQETKAPTGYFINNEVFVRKITTSGHAEYVNTYNQPEVLEKVIKFDIKKVQAGTSTPVSGAVFRHTLPNGSTEDLETNGSGEITITGLASGTHKIKEIKSPDGYQLNPNEIVFNVASGTGKITFTSGTNSLVTHGTKDSGDGYATFADKVNPFDLKITKTNEHGKALKGAEFTLYSDADCKNVVDTQISDEKGLLSFKNLDVEKTYYFEETKAPQGYRIPVDENGKAYVHSVYVSATPQTNTFEFTVDGIKYDTSKTSGNVRLEGTKKDRVVAVDITNKTTQLLPETGSNGTIILVALGLGVLGLAYVASKRKKQTQDESK